MTREEAANILSNDIIDGHVEGNARFMDAFWFAVDNLKTEPCEDAVSRQAALKAFEELPHEYKTKEQRARTGGIAACQVIVEELPSVTPKQRTGKWIREFNDIEGEVRFTCSSCGEFQLFGTYFCPNCGAKMKGEIE